jgi:hypothetical protein
MAYPTDAGPESRPRRGPAWGKIIGFSCGGCLVTALLLGLGITYFARQVMHKTPLLPSQQSFTGDWQGADGTKISIRADGTGNFQSGSSNVTGGQTKINETSRTLEIGLFGIKKTWRIDQPPRTVGGAMQMKLDGMLFRRTAGFNP